MSEHLAAAQSTAVPATSAEAAQRVAVACLIGTTIEWYDFFIYGTAAALIFNTQFFPQGSSTLAAMAAFGTFAVGFVARPVGAAVMGHYGDKIGRKAMLVLSLLTMGVATVLIGILPTYAQIGVLAPVLLVLLRLLQGFGVGGEWGGAILMAVEHAPASRRGFYGGFPQMGVAAGLILANLAFLLVTLVLSDEAFASYGWRIPFIISAVLVVLGLYVRATVSESPVFAAMKSKGHEQRMPIIEVFRRSPRQVLLGGMACLAQNGMGYVVLVFMLSYGTTRLGLPRSTMLAIIIAANVLELAATLYFAKLSDRLGRRTVFLGGTGCGVIVGALFFTVVDTGSAAAVLAAVVAARLCIAAMYGPLAAMLCEMFDTDIRFSGISISYQLGSIVGGALAPFIASLLLAGTGTSLSVSAYMAALCLISFFSVLAIRETRAVSLSRS
ncbi:MFS transporter [Roseomonas sp. BN140053]|uniref:MFS transporter n=1 Tax=Roseomonas sp. BN140053 TaxID=3391898 RepID=UPI0039EA70E3